MWTNKQMMIIAAAITVLAVVIFKYYKHFYPAAPVASNSSKTPVESTAVIAGDGPVAIPPNGGGNAATVSAGLGDNEM